MRARWLVAALAVALATSIGAWAQSETSGRSTAQDVPKRDAAKDRQDTAKDPKPPASVTVIGARDAHGILGREVRSAADENMGRIVDVIVDRGERKVIRRLANNASARFSEAGFTGMVAHAERDDELTEILGLRIDLPIKLLRDLLRRAKDA
ncbi:hypothetical protein KXV85_001846, partial [Aspergillus fumigatus]